ncbi:hypothetical protein BDP27DRAFT_1338819 [Rhodocollybia butyracea]|uniref:Uncharacterized protein n=1 Tax=Rhodocollybia butyracea TaxID=206335 RepID=A0A9P5U0X8_9AGAR|nr:hypothetical protein BDP27DRAFT_1338819 [Rhodocollybia butyracea]
MCKKVDPGGDDASVPVVECESDAYVNADNTLTPYDWFLHDPIHLRNSSSRNPSSMPPAACSLAALCQIFQKPSRGRMLPAPKTGNNNLSRDSMNLDSIPRRVSPFWKPTKMDISMHTELNLFQTFPEAALEQPYWVSGVSKLMCIGCYTVIKKAFLVILRRHMVHGLCAVTASYPLRGQHQMVQIYHSLNNTPGLI